MRINPLLIALALVARAPSTHAQDLGLVTGLFKDVHSVTVYGQTFWPSQDPILQGTDSCLILGLCGAGTEVLIDLTAPGGTHLELGLGASYSRGLNSRDSTLDLRGSIRSFPTFSAYMTWERLPGTKNLEPYLGLNFGLIELWNAQAYDRSRFEYGLKSQTFELGVTGGVYRSLYSLGGVFAELSYRRRRFSSVDYTFPSASRDKDSVPLGWPQELDLSGVQLALGWQFDLKEDRTPQQSLPGVWALSAVDGQKLPALVDQLPLAQSGQSSRRTEIISGLLTLQRDSARNFSLELLRRTSEVTAEGELVRADTLTRTTETGTYEISDRGVITLKPRNASGSAFPSVRIGNEIAVQLTSGGPRYHFTRPGS